MSAATSSVRGEIRECLPPSRTAVQVSKTLQSLSVGALLALCAAVRLPGLTLPFGFLNEWGQTIFAVFARNYERFGFVHAGVPIFSDSQTGLIVYANHPWLASVMLGCWNLIFGQSEVSFRSLALTVSLLSTLLVYLLGRRLRDHRTGLLAGLLFGLSPLSIHLGRVYGMEEVCLFYLLLFFYLFDRWMALPERGEFICCAGALLLAQASDIYGLILVPPLVLLGFMWRRNENPRWRGALLLAAIPPLMTVATVITLEFSGLARESYAMGVGRGTSGWTYWFKLSFWIKEAGFASEGYTFIVPILGFASLLLGARWLEFRPRDSHRYTYYGIWLLAVVQLFACTPWHDGHNYFIQFFGPPWALGTALLLARPGRRNLLAGGCCLALFGFLSWQAVGRWRSYYNPHDALLANDVREATTDQDLLIGLPPVMAYYIDRPYMIPYFTFVRDDYGNDQEKFFERVRSYCRGTNYARVILFKQFLRRPWVMVDEIDYSHALEGVEEFKLTSNPQLDPLVWTRVKR